MYEQRYIVARSRNHYHHDNSTVLSLLFAGGVDLGATSTNVYSVAISELFLHCLWATKYFVLPLTISIPCYEYMAVFLP